MNNYPLLVTCPKGLEALLKKELIDVGVHVVGETVGAVKVEGGREDIYTILLHSRIANRLLLSLYESPGTKHALVQTTTAFNWQDYLTIHDTFAITFHGLTNDVTNTMYGAQLIKDGISDHFRHLTGQRPSVSKHSPTVQLQAQAKHGKVSVYLDILGQSMHARGYRLQQGEAPLKENVASALLMYAGWPMLINECRDAAFIDPFCGSGTLLVEAWQMATDYVPGLRFGAALKASFPDHDNEIWQVHYQRAHAAHLQKQASFKGTILGFDKSQRMVDIACANIEAAGLNEWISISCRPIEHLRKPPHLKKGLIATNPPYGQRLEDVHALLSTYQQLGRQLAGVEEGWQLAVLTLEEKLARAIGLKSHKRYAIKNGKLDCQLYLFHLNRDNHFNPEAASGISKEGQMLLNRLKKNQTRLAPWLAEQTISAYRLYDADLPEFNVAIDVYGEYVHVQEYMPPKTVDEKKALQRLQTVLDVLVFGWHVPSGNIAVKQRSRQKGKQQYQKLDDRHERLIVQEGQIECWVNLFDYLDTGLFLDHRRLRSAFEKKQAKRFLNLFCYTSVASLHAARGGAKTTNVDLSKTYLNWSKDNFRLNHFTIKDHQFVQADVVTWLSNDEGRYDVIFCDPPSFSNSKRMEGTLDVQRDHIALIEASMARLTRQGTLYFSCNLKRFQMDETVKSRYHVNDITEWSTSKDFMNARGKRYAFEIKHKH